MGTCHCVREKHQRHDWKDQSQRKISYWTRHMKSWCFVEVPVATYGDMGNNLGAIIRRDPFCAPSLYFEQDFCVLNLEPWSSGGVGWGRDGLTAERAKNNLRLKNNHSHHQKVYELPDKMIWHLSLIKLWPSHKVSRIWGFSQFTTT